MSEVYGTHERRETYKQFWWGKLRELDYLEDVGASCWIIPSKGTPSWGGVWWLLACSLPSSLKSRRPDLVT
jgi:hypothetical protein